MPTLETLRAELDAKIELRLKESIADGGQLFYLSALTASSLDLLSQLKASQAENTALRARVEEIRREALEKAWERVRNAIEFTVISASRWEPGIVSEKTWVDGGTPMFAARENILRAAILDTAAPQAGAGQQEG